MSHIPLTYWVGLTAAVVVVVFVVILAVEREKARRRVRRRYESGIVEALKAAEKEIDSPGMTIDEFEQWSEKEES